ncbi:DEAD/DEAH box helicase [Anaerolinea sp.]|uniref:DEAD/DEAH box helicase n=1 Tax=Anaerolinea sp. TaxID=1872519 RepID=UPI002ACD4991|nr:DEAD/DEAH box helicase [Anaerolinea sp.]
MSIFDLHNNVLNDYRDFVRSFLTIADERIRAFVDRALEEEAHLWPDFLLQISPSYQRGLSVDALAHQGILHAETARIFRTPQGKPFYLYRHQEQAIEKASRGESYVVTSGTGSGKSLTYFIPIVENILRNPVEDKTIALIVYPMNALVNSQVQALETLKKGYEERTGRPFPVTFDRYTGETGDESRQRMRQHPPHILLTNYMMAELMLVRPEDQRFLDAAGGGLRFLVFDELHTYRGRQGADVAMLIRRLKERAAGETLIHVGTSATMVSDRNATPEQRRQVVAEFASRFFGHPFTESDIIEETLVPFTEGGMPSEGELSQALAGLSPQNLPALSLEEYRKHPLSRWIEHTFGLEAESNGRYKRRTPISLPEAAEQLAEQSRSPRETCEQILRSWLLLGEQVQDEERKSAFAIKLHQFIGQGRALFATPEPPDRREFTLEGKIQASEGRIFLPVRFCRQCGQDYYHVLKVDHQFLPHPLGNAETDETHEAGYLMLAPAENDWSTDYLPEEWLDSRGRIRNEYRDRVPYPVWVSSNGEFSTSPSADAVKMWYQPQPFSLCLNCGEYYTRREDDFRKLATLSSEGRSSATTVLAVSLLRQAARTKSARDKLLTFTDNRQDASLQAGHFNDFIHLAVLRSALVSALRKQDTLTHDNFAQEVVEVLKRSFHIRDIAKNSDLDPDSQAAQSVWETFTDLTEYRLYEDLRRGWRVLQPNLEELGLLRIEYRGLEDVCTREDLWGDHPAFSALEPQKRFTLVRTVLDYFRRNRALNAKIYEEQQRTQLRRRCEQNLNEFWGVDSGEQELNPAEFFVLRGNSNHPVKGKSLGERSTLGRYFIKALQISPNEYRSAIEFLLCLLVRQGFLVRRDPIQDHQRFQLDVACLLWKAGDGTPPQPDPLYSRRATAEIYAKTPRPVNAFFQRFYQESASDLAGLEAREHTAQVVTPGEREKRERRFRWEDKDNDKERELGRRLPYLVCSPTMELGIDIADLDIVHMRNVPPTPANYAQRSGRAGRQGQAGLIFTYCGALNPHDQYFFHNRQEMVAGSVRAPKLDLTNENLIRAHLHALWLGEVRLPMRQSIKEVIDIDDEHLPLRSEVQSAIQLSQSTLKRLRERMRRALQADEALLQLAPWFSDAWMDRVLENAPQEFDRAFDRWRELYRTAKNQRKEGRDEEDNAWNQEDQERAKRKQEEARRQLNLLLQIEVTREESDFYPYRYLASEGFLPGYNFPALPVRAWVPRGNGEFISRARFLALREFAPGNFLYHEGARWEIYGFQSPPGGLKERRKKLHLCYTCGTFCDPNLDLCPVCHTRFHADNSKTVELLEMPNVKTRRNERITSDEEERRRRGYLIETFYQFAPAPQGKDSGKQEADAQNFQLIYGSSATLLRVNHGLRSQNSEGFRVDLESGEIVNDHTRQLAQNHQRQVQTVRLSVQETQNILLFRPNDPRLFENRDIEITLRVALQRGLEQVYQLEENELAAESIGKDEQRAILFYETSEGGSGVLRRLMEEPNALAKVAHAALKRLHFDENDQDRKSDCAAACYECLLSYSNQLDAMHLNRHLVHDILVELSRSSVLPRISGRTYFEHLQWLRSLTDSRSELERRFLDVLSAHHYRLPDDAQFAIPEHHCVPDFFYKPDVCVFCDGSVHDEPAQRAQDERIRQELREHGYRVLVIRYDQDLEKQIRNYPEVFGIG